MGKDKFHVNSQSGDITLAKELDYDAQPGGYQFPVKVTDGGGKSSTATLKINIIDVNEAPFFTNPCVRTIPGCSFSTQEEKTAGQSVATMAASDPDKTQSCLLRFSIISSDNVYFSIGETNGQIKTRDKINRELKENYRLTVRVRDCANPPLTASTVVRVTATDINDNKPLFPVNQYLASVQENQGRIHFLTVYATGMLFCLFFF